MDLHFQTYGAGEPLIILHGLFGSLQNWHNVALQLGSEFHVYALDQRNHGRSPHDTRMDYPTMAEDLREFFERQSVAPAHLLGHSMGGKTAMQFTLSNPERVRSLISVDVAPVSYPPRHAHILAALTALHPEQFATRKQMEDALARELPDLATRRFLLKNVVRGNPGQFHWQFALNEISQNYDRLCEGITASRQSQCPALFVRGCNSDYLLPEHWPAIQKLFPRAQLVELPHAGHWVQAENPSGLLRAIREFLSRTEPEAQ